MSWMRSSGVLTVGAILLIGGLMQLAVSAAWVSELIIPKPMAILTTLVSMLSEATTWNFFLITLTSTLVANTIAIVGGLVIGFSLYFSPRWSKAMTPMFAALFAAPMILLYPIFLVLFGRTQSTIVIMGAITGLIPVLLNTTVALDGVPRTFHAVARSFRCTRWQHMVHVIFPAAAPGIFVGIRLGLIYSLVNIIGIEFLINFGGLGYLVSHMYDLFEITKMYAAILLVIAVSAIFYAALNWAQRQINQVSAG